MNANDRQNYTQYLKSVGQELNALAVSINAQPTHSTGLLEHMKKDKEGSDIMYLPLEPKTPCLYGVGAGQHAAFDQDRNRSFTIHIGLFYPVNQKRAGKGKNLAVAIEILRRVEQDRSDFFLVKPGDILPNGYGWHYLHVIKRYYHSENAEAPSARKVAGDLLWLVDKTYDDFCALPK